MDWDRGSYEETGAELMPAAEHVVARAGIEEGQTVLDLGTGTGNAAAGRSTSPPSLTVGFSHFSTPPERTLSSNMTMTLQGLTACNTAWSGKASAGFNDQRGAMWAHGGFAQTMRW